jgi:hypothetical protein
MNFSHGIGKVLLSGLALVGVALHSEVSAQTVTDGQASAPIGRRIVTGLDDQGQSKVVAVDDVMPGRFLYWRTPATPAPLHSLETMAAIPYTPGGPPRGSEFALFEIPPIPPGTTLEQLEAAYRAGFARLGLARGDTTRHPGMHTTPTLDYVIVVQGEVTLMLGADEIALKPLDVVIQRMTDHAWINTGTVPVLLMAVVLDARGSVPE